MTRVVMSRRELRLSTPTFALLGAALVPMPALYGKSIWNELAEALVAGTVFGSTLLFLWHRRVTKLSTAGDVPPRAEMETQARTVRRAAVEGAALAGVLALSVPAFDGETGALAGSCLAGAAASPIALRKLVCWERAHQAVVWRERKIRWGPSRFFKAAERSEIT